MKRLGGALIAVSALLLIGATWWWALLGMTTAVGMAMTATIFVIFCAGLYGVLP